MGVGNYLKPGFDVASVSRSHINRLFLSQFSPLRVAREGLRGAPELVDALVKAPMLVTEGLRVLEATTRRPPQNPFTGIRGTIFAGFALVAGAVILAFGDPWPLWAALFTLALILAFRRTRRDDPITVNLLRHAPLHTFGCRSHVCYLVKRTNEFLILTARI